MTSEQILEVIQAFIEGKKIQFRLKDSPSWYDVEYPKWNFQQCIYRIKSEPQYRSFKDRKEVIESIQKHGCYIIHNETLLIITEISDKYIYYGAGRSWYSLEEAFKSLKFADNTPFGVKE